MPPTAPAWRASRIPGLAVALCGLAAIAPATAGAATGERIVDIQAGVGMDGGRAAVHAAGGHVTRDLHLIHAIAARLPAHATGRLRRDPRIAAVVTNPVVHPSGSVPKAPAAGSFIGSDRLATAYPLSSNAVRAWQSKPYGTGRGVAVAVLDTGVQGDLPDFRNTQADAASRVIASAVVNPAATTATDRYGHGTHVAGIIAGNGWDRPKADPLLGRYVGVAPEANIVSVKISDDDGNASAIDVIYGLQFAVDQRAKYGIRVVNLSLNSELAQDPATDPIDAAVDAAWRKGLVVVAAAGNRGTAPDAVSYAPGNDAHAITVGGVDDRGTQGIDDDAVADWSSSGRTQQGVAKPEILAPGAHIVSTFAPKSAFGTLCPSCVVSDQYFRVGGTSMAAAVVSGAAATVIQTNPTWTPDQVKGALMNAYRDVSGMGHEVSVDKARRAASTIRVSNQSASTSALVTSTGDLDYGALAIRPAQWQSAPDALHVSWTADAFACDCATAAGDPTIDTTRARWTRARWTAEFSK